MAATPTYVTGKVFTNTYKARGKAVLEGKKLLSGREFKVGDEFTFTLSSANGGKLPRETSVTIKPTEGTEVSYTFDEIIYDESDVGKTYIYNVIESGKGDGITNDAHTHVAKVTITDPDKDGNLIVAKDYDDGDHLTFVNMYTVDFYVSKTDITGETELAGAALTVFDKDGNVVDSWTSEEGKSHKIDSGKLMGGETYTLHEELPPDGCALAQDVTFTVNTDGKVQKVTMKDEVTQIHITKTDITGSKELGGAKLEVRDEDNKVIETWTSEEGKTHEINGKLIAGKTYTLHEEIAPDGYVVANDIVFTVNMDGTPTTVQMKDDITRVYVTKTDITGDKELGGAKLVIKDKNGDVVDTWTSVEGETHIIEGVLIAGETYTLHEEISPDGYALTTDIVFTVKEDGSVQTVQMKDETTKVHVRKTDITGDKEIGGAKLVIKDKNGDVVDSWTSVEGKTHIVEGKLIAGETYTLHEEQAPDGYVIASDIIFVVNEDGKVQTVVMKDDTTKVHISKTDITGDKEIGGAKLVIKDKNGDVVDSWTSVEGESHIIEGILIAGETYTLHEEQSPDGYVVASDIIFVVDEDGKVQTVVMKDDTTKIHVSKTDITGDKEIGGAKLVVKDKNDIIVDTWTSVEGETHIIEGVLIAGETYTLHEEQSPDGYVIASDIVFEVKEDGSVQTVVMKDDTTKVHVSKTDITGDKEIGGAKLVVKDKNGDIVDSWTSVEGETHIIEGVLIAGETYTLHEEQSPDGYVIASDIVFEVKEDGSVQTVVMVDDTTKVHVSKTDITGDKEIGGAKLVVIDKNGDIVDSWTSVEGESHKIEGVLIAGETYTLREEQAPNGYVIASEIVFTVGAKVHISKTDITGDKEIGGAKLVVIDKKGKVVDSWTSVEGESHKIEGILIAGETYTLREEQAPKGYVIASEITFTVNEDGTVQTVVMKDDTTKVHISKTDITGDKEIGGAKLVVKDKNGKVVDSWTSKEGKTHKIEGKLIAGETYTLHEEQAPNGYVIASDITFTVREDGTVQTVVMKDDTTKVRISKTDITGDKEIGGAKLVVIDKNGNIVDSWTSVEGESHMIEGVLIAGETYTLHEEQAPNGYLIASDITFTVNEDGTVLTVVMKDDTDTTIVKTGDTTPLLMWTVIMMLAAAALVMSLYYRRKRRTR